MLNVSIVLSVWMKRLINKKMLQLSSFDIVVFIDGYNNSNRRKPLKMKRHIEHSKYFQQFNDLFILNEMTALIAMLKMKILDLLAPFGNFFKDTDF